MLRQALSSIIPDRTAYELLVKLLRRAVRQGSLALIDPWGERHVVGTGDAPFVTVRLAEPGEAARIESQEQAVEGYLDKIERDPGSEPVTDDSGQVVLTPSGSVSGCSR